MLEEEKTKPRSEKSTSSYPQIAAEKFSRSDGFARAVFHWRENNSVATRLWPVMQIRRSA